MRHQITNKYNFDIRANDVNQFQAAAELINKVGNLVAFTGAGISVDAGIPAFRGGQGLWDRYDPWNMHK